MGLTIGDGPVSRASSLSRFAAFVFKRRDKCHERVLQWFPRFLIDVGGGDPFIVDNFQIYAAKRYPRTIGAPPDGQARSARPCIKLSDWRRVRRTARTVAWAMRDRTGSGIVFGVTCRLCESEPVPARRQTPGAGHMRSPQDFRRRATERSGGSARSNPLRGMTLPSDIGDGKPTGCRAS